MTEEENYFLAYPGGIIECSKAITFQGDDGKEITLPNRFTITYGKKKAVLKGAMVKAIYEAYRADEIIQAWCEKC